MSVTVNPPPLYLPPQLAQDKEIAGYFDALLRTIYLLWNEVFTLRFKEKTTTKNADVTPLQRFTVDTDKSIYLEAKVIARRTGGTSGTNGDTAFYNLQGCFKNIGGVLTQVAASILNGGEDQAGWDCGFAISGTDAVVVGVGALNNEITWESSVTFYVVGV